MKLQSLREQSDLIMRIASAHGASNVRVTGSVARGEAGEDSDVDLIVDLAPDRTVRDLSELTLDLSDALGCRVEVFRIPATSTFARGSAAPALLRDAVRLMAPDTVAARQGQAARDRRHIESIGESLARVSNYVAGGRAVSFAEWMVHDAVVQRLADIADSVRRLSAT